MPSEKSKSFRRHDCIVFAANAYENSTILLSAADIPAANGKFTSS
ncbi:hypothetical protein [Neisseria zalophi]|nr:hypothetical protein [Neisseria zalophi]